MAEWIYFLHPRREDFEPSNLTDAEEEAWIRHFERLKQLTNDGVVVLAGPTLGSKNTGIVVFEADSESEAAEIMNADPTIQDGHTDGELRAFRISLLRGRP